MTYTDANKLQCVGDEGDTQKDLVELCKELFTALLDANDGLRTYGPEYVHGEPKTLVVKRAQKAMDAYKNRFPDNRPFSLNIKWLGKK